MKSIKVFERVAYRLALYNGHEPGLLNGGLDAGSRSTSPANSEY